VLANLILAAVYGACMGVFGLTRDDPEVRFLLADAVKVPLLLALTVAVTFPSLYVFNALVGSRLGVFDLARLLAAAMGVMVAVLAAFGPIVAFFSVTTTSYPFILLLNVGVFTLAAGFAVVFLLRAADVLARPQPLSPPLPPPPAPDAPPGELPQVEATLEGEPAPSPRASDRDDERDRPARRLRAKPVSREPDLDPRVRAIFRAWLCVFALVGAQMSWVLRPFVGKPNEGFELFGPRKGSFFEAVWEAARSLFN
ncbi:MAG: hypothetical protein K2V38_24280, partial [Gemmataceae bacterium]|nr:hypothetical protein [Gemmataceae bacterium]